MTMLMNVIQRPILPAPVKKSLNRVSRKLSSFGVKDFVNEELHGPSTHLFKKRGKLVRPILVLMGAHFIGCDTDRYVDLALASELMHVSSLIHDDIIDNDGERRGMPTVHSKYGDKAAILGGDALIAEAVMIASAYGGRIMEKMAKASMDMCAGELLDYGFQKSGKVPGVEECLDIAGLKSASLIASCCSIAAVHRNRKQAGNMYRFGKALGMAFQIRDDIMDYITWSKGRKRNALVPNIVSSLEAENGDRRMQSVLDAVELNGRYVTKAISELDDVPEAELLKGYARLIQVST